MYGNLWCASVVTHPSSHIIGFSSLDLDFYLVLSSRLDQATDAVASVQRRHPFGGTEHAFLELAIAALHRRPLYRVLCTLEPLDRHVGDWRFCSRPDNHPLNGLWLAHHRPRCVRPPRIDGRRYDFRVGGLPLRGEARLAPL